MDIAIATDYFSSGGDPENALRYIAEAREEAGAGFTHLHWCHQWNTDHFYTTDEIVYIKSLLKKYDLKLLDIHGSEGSIGGGPLCCWYNPQEVYRKQGVEIVKNRIEMLHMLEGTGTVMMHIPMINRNSTEEQKAEQWARVDALRKSLDELMPMCEQLGVPLSLENGALDTFEILEKVFSEYPAECVGLCYDSGHGNIDWKDGSTANGIECLERNLDRLQALHFHDNNGGGDQHQPPLYGIIDWKRLCDDVRKSAYPRCFSFEMSQGNTPFKDKYIEFLKDAYERCVKVISL